MNIRRLQFSFFSALLLLLAACAPDTSSESAITKDEAGPATGVAAIAIPDPYAGDIAEEILRRGGNAVDASIATGFALAVTYIDAGNIGGGGFMTIHHDGESAFLDYREKAPLAADRDMYLDDNGEVIPNSTLIGGQAAAVPGTVAGFWLAHQRWEQPRQPSWISRMYR